MGESCLCLPISKVCSEYPLYSKMMFKIKKMIIGLSQSKSQWRLIYQPCMGREQAWPAGEGFQSFRCDGLAERPAGDSAWGPLRPGPANLESSTPLPATEKETRRESVKTETYTLKEMININVFLNSTSGSLGGRGEYSYLTPTTIKHFYILKMLLEKYCTRNMQIKVLFSVRKNVMQYSRARQTLTWGWPLQQHWVDLALLLVHIYQHQTAGGVHTEPASATEPLQDAQGTRSKPVTITYTHDHAKTNICTMHLHNNRI